MSQDWNNTEVPSQIVFHLVSQAFEEIKKKERKTNQAFLFQQKWSGGLPQPAAFEDTPSLADGVLHTFDSSLLQMEDIQETQWVTQNQQNSEFPLYKYGPFLSLWAFSSRSSTNGTPWQSQIYIWKAVLWLDLDVWNLALSFEACFIIYLLIYFYF